MITMPTHGKHGRLGNQLFQLMSMIGLAKESGQDLVMPSWQYAQFFNVDVKWANVKGELTKAFEHQFHHDKRFHSYIADGKNYEIKGYFQSKKYWLECEDEIKVLFTWNKDFHNSIYAKQKLLFSRETIAIHVRRGDYVGNKNYHNLNVNYYIKALYSIPDWDKMNILVFSDDPNWCKVHFNCLSNATVIEGNTDIDDLCLMSMCDRFILSNSTFAWMGAYLSNAPGVNVIRPTAYFTGPMSYSHETKDFWPEDWVQSEATGRIPINDFTFVIPFYNDHEDRVENLTANLRHLLTHFQVRVIVGEWGQQTIELNESNVTYMNFPADGNLMHRTKMLNDMIKLSTTSYVANWDTDVFIAPLQVLEAIKELRQGAEIVYPYTREFNRVQRVPWYKMLSECNDIGIFGCLIFEKLNSLGGAVFYDKKAFIDAGMENEKCVSFGPEDAERFERFTTLGFKIEFQRGCLFHLEHHRGINSGKKHRYIDHNRQERNKVKAMSRRELIDYIKSWPWLQ